MKGGYVEAGQRFARAGYACNEADSLLSMLTRSDDDAVDRRTRLLQVDCRGV